MSPVNGMIRVGSSRHAWGKKAPTISNPGDNEPPPAGTRIAKAHPFTSDSIWNRSLGVDATLVSASDSRVVNLRATTAQFNWSTFTVARWVGSATDPQRTVSIVNDAGAKTGVTYTIRRPTGADLSGEVYDPNLNPDSWLAYIRTDNVTVDEFYKAAWDSDGVNLTAKHYNTYRLDSAGLAQVGGLKASDLPYLGGILTKTEVSSTAAPVDRIRHALTFSAPNSVLLRPSSDTEAGTGWRWPARTVDANASTAYQADATKAFPMGTIFTIAPTTNIETLKLTDGTTIHDDVKALAYAIRDYGLVLSDRSTYLTLYAELGSNSTVCGRMKTGWQQAIKPLLTAVSNNSETNPMGPGARRRTTLPEVSVG